MRPRAVLILTICSRVLNSSSSDKSWGISRTYIRKLGCHMRPIYYLLPPTQEFRLSCWSSVSLLVATRASLCVCSVAQSCPALCDPADGSMPDSSEHRIFQAGILEWVAISFSRRSFQPRDRTCISWVSCTAGRFFTTEPSGKIYEDFRYVCVCVCVCVCVSVCLCVYRPLSYISSYI